MSKQLLDKARDLILRQDYDAARDILRSLAERSTTAQRWLRNLDEMQAAAGDMADETGEQMQAEREALDKIVDVDEAGTDESPVDNARTTGARHDVMGVPVTITDVDDDEEVGMVSYDGDVEAGNDDLLPPDEFEAQSASVATDVNEMPVTITDVDEMPIDDLAGILPPGEEGDAPGGVQWEYREVVLQGWESHMQNVEAALDENADGEQVMVADSYTQQLNAVGADGWEVVSEQVLAEQRVRLLMKRRKSTL